MKVWLGIAFFVLLTIYASYLIKNGLAQVRVIRTPSLSAKTLLSEIMHRDAVDERTRRMVMQAFDAPIVFYGKVVDDAGNPVAQATVQFYVSTNPVEEPVVLAASSDENGEFNLSGIRGARCL